MIRVPRETEQLLGGYSGLMRVTPGPLSADGKPLFGDKTVANQKTLAQRPKRDHDEPEMTAWLERYRGCDYELWLRLVDYLARSDIEMSANEYQHLISLSPHCHLVDTAGAVIGEQNLGRGFDQNQLAYNRMTIDRKLWKEKGYVPYHLGRPLPRSVRKHQDRLPAYPRLPEFTRYEVEVSASDEFKAAVAQYSADRAAYQQAVNDMRRWLWLFITFYLIWQVLKAVLIVAGVLVAIASVVGIIAIIAGAGKTPTGKAHRRGLLEGAAVGAVVGSYATRRSQQFQRPR
jgi:hypothetical protein